MILIQFKTLKLVIKISLVYQDDGDVLFQLHDIKDHNSPA